MRRHGCDPLADTRRPHWLTVSDLHRNLITCEALPAGADLREILRAALAQCAAEGWQAENDGAYGFAFIARGLERMPREPASLPPAIGHEGSAEKSAVIAKVRAILAPPAAAE